MPALRTIALVVMAACGTAGHAAGLGSIRLQSALGQPLRASVSVLGANMPELTPSCIKVRLDQPDGTPMMAVRAAVSSGGETADILLSTRQPVNEPAVTLSLQVTCDNSIQRSYQLLLDPVVFLPQLPQPAPQASSRSETGKSRLREQAMVASMEDAVAPAPVRRAAERKARNDQPVSVAAQGASPVATRKTVAAQQEPRKMTRSVLKLSGDDVAIEGGAAFLPELKLSDTLSESRDTGDAQGAAELKKAYDRFAAVLRDEDPLRNGEMQLKDMQAKLQELESQTARLREQGEQQRLADREALARVRRDTVSSRWVVALGGLLLAALGAIGWLYHRIREIGREQSTELWARTSLGQPTEPGDWENTLGTDETLVTAGTMNHPRKAGKSSGSSDWERGIPLDGTLAVDWASRQATLQEPPLQMPEAGNADLRHDDTAEDTLPDDGVQPDAEPVTWQTHQASPPGKHEAPKSLQASHAAGKTAAAAPQRPDVVQAAADKRNGGAQLLEVGEISDLMQEAEFWMLLNDPERAIEILEPSRHAGRPVSPVPWIYLLDLYRVTGRQENYQALAARLKQVFNTSAPAWSEPDAEIPARSLRDYLHVVKTIEDLWEGEEILPYLESLLLDEREGGRVGFDLAVYREIIHLIGVACDPETPRRREQLSFDDPQPRLISQQVSMPSARPAKDALLISEDEAEVFDRATSWQATSRQVASKIVAPKATESKAAESKAAEPKTAEPKNMPSQTPGLNVLNVLEAATQAPASAYEILNVEMALPVVDVAPAPAAFTDATTAAVASVVPSPAAASEEDAERMADMARKLDLVVAYQEIGENVGARVLLEEVIQGGSPLQVEKAKAMLKKLLKEIDWQ